MINQDIGIHADMPFSEYLEIDAMNCSTLKKVSQSPLHAKYELTTPSEPSAAFVIGDAFHGLVLEPDRFDAEYACGLDRPKRTKVDKEAWEEWTAANEGVTALKPDDYHLVHDMRDAVMSHPIASDILAGEGQNEVTMIWEDPVSGTVCKGRADRITTYKGDSVIADLKSTINASPEDFAKSSARFLYHCQAAWYLDGANILAPRDRQFLFLAVEKKAPHGVLVMELDEDAIKAGAKLNRIYLKRWLKCLKTKNFTGYPERVVTQGLPGWALNAIDKMEED